MTRKSGDWPSAISSIDPSIDAPVTAIRWGHLYRRLAGEGGNQKCQSNQAEIIS